MSVAGRRNHYLGLAAGALAGTLGYLHNKQEGALQGARYGYDAASKIDLPFLKRKREDEGPAPNQPPGKKPGFWRTLWDNGGKEAAIIAGTAAGTYGLAKLGQYVDRRTHGRASRAVGRFAGAAMPFAAQAIGRYLPPGLVPSHEAPITPIAPSRVPAEGPVNVPTPAQFDRSRDEAVDAELYGPQAPPRAPPPPLPPRTRRVADRRRPLPEAPPAVRPAALPVRQGTVWEGEGTREALPRKVNAASEGARLRRQRVHRLVTPPLD